MSADDTTSGTGHTLFVGGRGEVSLNHAAAVALGFVFLLLIVIVAAIGLWRQAQAERQPRRRSGGPIKRVDLMSAVMPRDQDDAESRSSRRVPRPSDGEAPRE